MVLRHSSFHVHSFFFQANTIGGYRFFDYSGRILNKWVNAYEHWNNGMEGVVLRDAKEADAMPFALRVNAQSIWFRFIEPQTLGGGVPIIFPLLRDISSILGVEAYSRLGLRVEYYSPIDPDSPSVRALVKNALGSPLQPDLEAIRDGLEFEVVIKGKARDIGLRLSTRTLKTTRPPRDPGDYHADGVIFDIDAYNDQETKLSDVRAFLARAKTAIEDTFNTTGRLLYQEGHEYTTN